MKSIQNILQTEGIEFLDSLMNDYLVVYEKLNASTLSFRRIGNELKFYKGRDNEEITSLNETLYTYFKEGIEYLRRVSLIFYMEFPEGWLFRMQYFNPNAPGLVNYELRPKNNLVLSCIDTGNCIIEDRVLKHWADRLQIDVAEPVFSGFLSEFQKEKLMDYANGNVDCENISFSQYIISLLNPGISHSAYSDAFNTIDSFIFKFYKAGSKKCIPLKLVDPYMDELLKQNKDKFGTNSGTENEIILANFVAWLQTIDLKEIDIEGECDDDRYLDLLCKLFNKYAEKEQKLLKDLKSNLNESYTVDLDKIGNSETAKILKDNPNMTKAFQVIVGSFMNKKNDENDPMSIMDDGLKELFNDEVSSIKRLTSTKDDQVKSFTELMKSSMETDSDKESDSNKVMSFTELMDKIGYAEPEKEDEPEEAEQKAEEAEPKKAEPKKAEPKKAEPKKTEEEVKEEHEEEKESEDSETEKSENEKTDSEKSESSHESDSSDTTDEKSEESSDEDEKSEDEDSKEDEDKKEEETKDDNTEDENTEDEKTDKDESDDKKESEEKTDDLDNKPGAEQEEKEHSATVSTSSEEGSDKPKEKEKKEKPAKEDSGDGGGFAL